MLAVLQHPRTVLRFSRRLSTAVIALTLGAGSPTLCAGWMPTPEARMACCSDDGPCPMHKSPSHENRSAPVVTQAEADRCCATPEQDDSAPSTSIVAFAVSLALVPSAVPVLLPDAAARADAWRTAVRVPVTRVPKHLLLSVFLV
jgi:hypothetical protein